MFSTCVIIWISVHNILGFLFFLDSNQIFTSLVCLVRIDFELIDFVVVCFRFRAKIVFDILAKSGCVY